MTGDFDPNWTFEQVVDAQEEAEKQGMDRFNLKGPYWKWVGLHQLDDLEERFVKGEKFALMEALYICSSSDLPIPDWAAKAYTKCFNQVRWAYVGSWDEAFGRPFEKGTHVAKIRRHDRLKVEVYIKLRRYLKNNPDVPIDEHLFELIGKEVGISRSLANKLYYEGKDFLDDTLPRIFDRSWQFEDPSTL